MRIVVVGAGIAGLGIAFQLRRQDPSADVILLERSDRTGGNIRTEHVNGFTCEWGPDGFLDNAPATLSLVSELGLTGRLQPSLDAARRRFIARRGALHEVPTSAASLLTTPLLSARAKLRVALEPFARQRREDDESIHDFAARRIGREPAEILVGSMVSGVYAGDARELSLGACFPKMRQMEDEHGSLIRAAVAGRRQRRDGTTLGVPRGRLTSFATGMSELVDALTGTLNGGVRTGSPLLRLTGCRDGYDLLIPRGTLHADAVVLTGPAAQSATVLGDSDPTLADLLAGIPTAPLAVVCLGYAAAEMPRPDRLNGFGFLVAPSERLRILGAQCESSIYPRRAPAGKVLLRVMIGGARDPGAVTLDDDQLLDVVRRDLARTLEIVSAPEFVRIIRHTRGIPQYVRGHSARLQQIGSRLEAFPGLFLAGSSYRGVSLNSCLAEAPSVAAAVLRYLAARREPAFA